MNLVSLQVRNVGIRRTMDQRCYDELRFLEVKNYRY